MRHAGQRDDRAGALAIDLLHAVEPDDLLWIVLQECEILVFLDDASPHGVPLGLGTRSTSHRSGPLVSRKTCGQGAGFLVYRGFTDSRPPGTPLLLALAVAGCAAAAGTTALAFASDHLEEPGLRAGLLVWVALPFILAGLIAWWRRPQSRFGPLMVAAGFSILLSSLQWSNSALPYTVGLIFDLIPVVLFLHVYLAFPTGRLERLGERALVAAALLRGRGPPVREGAAGAGGPDNLLAVTTDLSLASTIEHVQLVTLAALCLAGIGVLVDRHRRAQRPLRPSIALLVDSFALGLVMFAALLLAGAFEWPSFETIRRITFGVIGIAPVAFLIGLLDARLARATVGDLLVELQTDPRPDELPRLLGRALRDPSVSLAYWLPEFESWADLDGREVSLPDEDSGRASTVIARDGVPPRRACSRPRADRRARAARRRDSGGRDRAGECAPAGGAPCSARGAGGIARACARGEPGGAQAARAEPPRRRSAAAGCALPEAAHARTATRRRPGRASRDRRGQRRDRASRSTSCARWPTGSTPRWSPATGWRWGWNRSWPARRSRCASAWTWTSA